MYVLVEYHTQSAKFADLASFVATHCKVNQSDVRLEFDGSAMRHEITIESKDLEDEDIVEATIP